jgi:pimeloyl-ACP methyl ester carboxylesterase
MTTTLQIVTNRFTFALDEAGDRLALCLHGFPESRFSRRFQLPWLAKLGYRAWATIPSGWLTAPQ